MPALPELPSREHLRKQAKRLARDRGLRLAEAQRTLAHGYGFRTWAELIAHVAALRGESDATALLFAAVRAGDVEAVRRRIADGARVRHLKGGETALHVAARRGPFAVVEVLIESGALEWQRDVAGRTPLEMARRGRSRDRAAIVALLDRSAIADVSFRAAVAAIHAGDVASLERLLDAEPGLLHARNVGPQAYRMAERHQYFRDPKLFWFVANNPTLVPAMPANLVDVAGAMIARGVERADLDYTLELAMSGDALSPLGLKLPLMRLLLAAGATANRAAIAMTAAHRQSDALVALLEAGVPLDAPIAASLGDLAALRDLLRDAQADDVQLAFGLAVINDHVRAAELALDAGADVRARLPVHAHSTALHQAAALDSVPMIEMLLARGADPEARDTLWDGTPFGWAMHEGKLAARAALEPRDDGT